VNSLIAAGLKTEASLFCCKFDAEALVSNCERVYRELLDVLPTPRGVNGAALAACDKSVGFFVAAVDWPDGVNAGESTLNVFLVLAGSQTHVVRSCLSTIGLLVCLWRGVLVLIVVECTALVFVATVAVDENVATEGVLVFYVVRSAAITA
jgi:hypothetical protein